MDDAFASKSFSPADVRFRLSKHGDHEFVVDGDPTVDQLDDMLRIEGQIRGDAVTEEELAAAAKEGRDLILALIREKQPDVTALRIGLQELTVVFSLIMRGSSVAEAVANAILAPPAAVPDQDGLKPLEDDATGDGVVDEGDGDPLASKRSSTGRSSSSGEPDAGLRDTGTG